MSRHRIVVVYRVVIMAIGIMGLMLSSPSHVPVKLTAYVHSYGLKPSEKNMAAASMCQQTVVC
jgi:hypothetical protein